MKKHTRQTDIRTAACLTVSSIAFLSDFSHAAVIFSDVDPAATNINALYEQIVGAFEDTNYKAVSTWGRIIPIAQNSTLRSATIPFNIGPSAGVRVDVFELPSTPYITRFGVTTTAFVHIGSSSSVEALSPGRQWVSFSFADFALVAGKEYLFRVSPDETRGVWDPQQHYWLSAGTAATMIRDDRPMSVYSPVPEATFGTTTSQVVLGGSIYLSDVAVVPEPSALTILLGGVTLLATRRRRIQ
jgi:hypothetical protein